MSLYCRACCPSCDLHFTSDGAFERHLAISGHRDPREARRKDGSPAFAVRTVDGRCRMVVADRDGRPVPPRVVVLWEIAGQRERAGAAFRAKGTAPSAQEAIGAAGRGSG